jgi:hypothetical protein
MPASFDLVEAVRAGYPDTAWYGSGSYARHKVEEEARRLIASGITAEAALSTASAAFDAGHVLVNGSYVFAAGARALPDDFAILATAFIRDWLAEFGDAEGYEKADVAVAFTGESELGLFDRRHGMPLSRIRLTISDLEAKYRPASREPSARPDRLG